MIRYVFLGALLLSLIPCLADGPDSQYVRIHSLIQEADTLNESGQKRAALAKYSEAQEALLRFQNLYQNWNERMVSYRTNYIANKIAPIVIELSFTNSPGLIVREERPVKSEVQQLEAELERMKNHNSFLNSKLKEALTVQPAGVDPRELQKAQQHLAALEKENELLKFSLDQEQARTTEALSEVDRQLAKQQELLSVLEKENETLRKQAAAAEQAGKRDTEAAPQIQRASKRIKELEEGNQALNAERARLERQLTELADQGVKAAQLQKELKAAIAENRRKQQDVAEAEKRITVLQKETTQAARKIKTLEQDNRDLVTEYGQLRKQVEGSGRQSLRTKDLERQLAAAVAELQKRQVAENELNDLRQKLASAQDGPGAGNNRLVLTDRRVKELKARLDVLEAKPVPYTAEELELFARPEVSLATVEERSAAALNASISNGGKSQTRKKIKDLPAGTGPLVAEAQRAFDSQDYAGAEAKYMAVLAQDKDNVYTLANLAAIRLEMHRLEEAEKSATQALALDPDDDFSLYILGRVKFQEGKMDEAIDALSRSVAVNPNNAETQNYLGIALSEKGLRLPAEIALRKAIQLQPGHAGAHNNLAVVYATQTPPSLALGRWHYQKALAAGHPKNAELEKLLDGRR